MLVISDWMKSAAFNPPTFPTSRPSISSEAKTVSTSTCENSYTEGALINGLCVSQVDAILIKLKKHPA